MHLLSAYAAVADSIDSRALGYVVKILIEDEQRHHMLFQELADSLRHDDESHPGDPAIPRLDLHADSAVRELTDQLVKR